LPTVLNPFDMDSGVRKCTNSFWNTSSHGWAQVHKRLSGKLANLVKRLCKSSCKTNCLISQGQRKNRKKYCFNSYIYLKVKSSIWWDCRFQNKLQNINCLCSLTKHPPCVVVQGLCWPEAAGAPLQHRSPALRPPGSTFPPYQRLPQESPPTKGMSMAASFFLHQRILRERRKLDKTSSSCCVT
jgi:hypothetical protein